MQNIKGIICGIAIQDSSCCISIRSHSEGIGCKHFHTGICTVGMGVHNSCCYLYKLANMSHKQDSFHAHIHGHINGFSHIIAALDISFERQRHMLAQIICPIVSRGHKKVLLTLGKVLLHFHMNAFYKSFFTHRLHNSGGSKNGNSPCDSQPGIKGLLADLYTFRNRNHNLQPSLIVMGNCSFFCFPKDHGTRNRIDRSFSHFLGEPGSCNSAYAHSTIYNDSGSIRLPHCSIHKNAICCVRIISGIFFHCTGNLIFTDLNVMQLQVKKDSLGSHKRYRC